MVNQILATRVPRAKTEPGDVIALGDLATVACNGTYQDEVLHARDMYRQHGKGEEYKDARKDLPLFTPSTTYLKRHKGYKMACAEHHTGVIAIDVDDLTDENVSAEIRETMMTLPGCWHAFISTSGFGVKAFFIVDPIPQHEEEHHRAFGFIAEMVARELDVELDLGGKDPSRLCYVSWDPDAEFNINAEGQDWTGWQPKEDAKTNAKQTATGSSSRSSRQKTGVDRSDMLASWLAVNFLEGDTEEDLIQKAYEADTTTSAGYSDPIGDYDRIVRIVKCWLPGKTPYRGKGNGKGNGQRFYRPSQSQTAENGNPIPDIYEPFTIGQWVARQSKLDVLGFAFDRETRAWFFATKTHWKQCDWDDVRGVVSQNYIDGLMMHAVRQISVSHNEEEKRWKANFTAIVRGNVFQHRLFQDALRLGLRRDLTPPATYTLATEGGVVNVLTGNIRPFDRDLHTHKVCLPVCVTKERQPEAYKKWREFVDDRFISKQMQSYAMCVFGQALIGESTRTIINLLGGRGCGKTTCMTALKTAMGKLCRSVSQALFETRGTHNAQLADLIEFQTRLAIMPEASEVKVDAGMLNQLSGGDTQIARRPHARGTVEGRPIALPVFFAEAPPSIRGTTAGTLERFKVLKFRPLREEDRNGQLLKDANDPTSDLVLGAFVWMCLGAQYVNEHGMLPVPQDVAEMSDKTVDTADPFAGYVKAFAKSLSSETATVIAERYNDHMGIEDNKLTAIGCAKALTKLGWEQQRKKAGGKSYRVWVPGI